MRPDPAAFAAAVAPVLPLACPSLPGTLSNPFTGGGGNNGNNSGRDAPHTMSYEDYLGRDELWGGANRHDRCAWLWPRLLESKLRPQ
jgi:hypothetical protein